MKRAAQPFGSGKWESHDEVTERGTILRWLTTTEDPEYSPGKELELLEAVPDDIVDRRKAELRALMAGDPVVEADPFTWNWTVLMIQRVVEAVTTVYGPPRADDPHAAGEHTHVVTWDVDGGVYWRAWERHPQRQELWREVLDGEAQADPLAAAPAAAVDPLLPTVAEFAGRIAGQAAGPGKCAVCGGAHGKDALGFTIAEHFAHYACVIKERRARRTEPSKTGAKVKAARKRVAGLTQQKLATFLGCKVGHVSQAELGAATFTPDELHKIAEAMGLPPGLLSDDTKELPDGPLAFQEGPPQPTQDLLGVGFGEADDQREPGEDRDEEH